MTANLTRGMPCHQLNPPRFRDASNLDTIDLLYLLKVGLPSWQEGEWNKLDHNIVEAWLDGGRWVEVEEEGLSHFSIQEPHYCHVAVELE